jgi:hypothetical protein
MKLIPRALRMQTMLAGFCVLSALVLSVLVKAFKGEL